MKSLKEIHTIHEEIKTNTLYRPLYYYLKNGKSMDHWDRVIMAIKGILYHYEVDANAFTENLELLVKEILFVKESIMQKFSEKFSDYSEALHTWLSSQANDKNVDDKGDLSLFVTSLRKEYKDYDFFGDQYLEAIELRKHLREKAIEKDKKITALRLVEVTKLQTKASKNVTNLPSFAVDLPKEILISILNFITDAKDLCSLEATCHHINKIIKDAKLWEFPLNTLSKDNSGFFSNRNARLEDPKIEYIKLREYIKNLNRSRKTEDSSDDSDGYKPEMNILSGYNYGAF